MATNVELEAQLLSSLAKKPDLKLAKALLLEPEHRSDGAQAWLRLALGVVAAAGGRAELAWLKKLAAKSQKSWPKTWMREWFLRSIASTGELIVRLLEGPVKPEKGAVPAKPQPRWLALAAQQDFNQLEALLANLVDGPATQISERARALLGWPKDARIARAALATHQGRLVSDPRHPLWNALANLIAVHSDSALRKTLGDLRVEDPALAWPHWVSHWKGGADPKNRPAAPAKAAGTPKNPEEWERWVLSAPEDLSRRALWADWLLEQGDPRGEFVALQLADRPLTPAEQKKVGTLARKHGRSWIGKLNGLADPKLLKFERGVLVGLRALPVPDPRIPAEDPQWAALEELELPEYGISPKLEQCALGCLPRLRSLDSLAVKLPLFEKVMAVGAPRLTRLGLESGFHAEALSSDQVKSLAGAKFPALRALRVSGQPGPKLLEQLVALPWFEALEHFCTDGGELAARLETLQATALTRIEVWAPHDTRWEPAQTGFGYRATRANGRWALELLGIPEKPTTVPVDHWYEAYLLPALSPLPGRSFTAVTLSAPEDFRPSVKVAAKLEARLEELTRA